MIEALLEEFKNKKVLIWGLGKEGLSTYKFIKTHLPNQKLYLCDSSLKEGYKEDYIVLEDDLDTTIYDLIIKAPGIVAYDRRGNISTQAALFLKYFSKNTIGITGTKGKSTTSSLLFHVLKHKYKDIFLVGNIGIPCFDILNLMDEDSIVVFEISCHQLEYVKKSPYIGVLLNLYEEHLDHYKSYQAYKDAKINVLRFQGEDDVAIVNSDLKDEIISRPNIVWTDTFKISKTSISNSLDTIKLEKTSLIGDHNFYNIAIVYYIAHTYFGISNKDFNFSLRSFIPLKHRLENIGTYKGVTYVNDSISTIGQATIKAIESLKNVGSVLIGGMDRKIDYQDLINYLKGADVDNIILMYESGKRILGLLKTSKAKVYYVDSLKEAVDLAKEVTKANKICLLSPAAASYGYFKNFEDRGEKFKEYIYEV